MKKKIVRYILEKCADGSRIAEYVFRYNAEDAKRKSSRYRGQYRIRKEVTSLYV